MTSTLQEKLDALAEAGIDEPARSELAALPAVTPWAVKEEYGKPDANPGLIVFRLRKLNRDTDQHDAREAARQAAAAESDRAFHERQAEEKRILDLDKAARAWLMSKTDAEISEAWTTIRQEMGQPNIPDNAWVAFPVRMARHLGWRGEEPAPEAEAPPSGELGFTHDASKVSGR